VPAAPAQPSVPAASETTAGSTAAAVKPSATPDSGRKPVPTANENASRSQPPSGAAAPLDVNAPRPAAIVNQPAVAPASVAPSAPLSAPGPAPAALQPAPGGPSVSVACQGAADVCEAIRSEIVRSLQADAFSIVGNQTAAETVVAVKVVLVSQTPSIQSGTPSIMRTYAVELTGNSRGTALVMPAMRVFSVDVLLGRATLQDNARQFATGVLEALRGLKEKGKN